LLPAVVVLVVTCTTRNVTLRLLYCAIHFLDLLNGQFDKTISYFLIKLLYSLLHLTRCSGFTAYAT